MLSQTITVPGVTLPFVRNYTYDSLNRLQSADEKPSGWKQTNCDTDPTKCWKQTFTFDRYGNRNFDEANTTTLPKECNNNTEVCAAIRPVVNPSVNTANNRLNGYTFDAAGNTTLDAENRTFVYDAENKQVSVSDTNGTIGTYFYDGDGKRVKKLVPGGETTIFAYDAGGALAAEYSTETNPEPTTSYVTTDHLGSPRVITDKSGNVIARRDFMPFGEELGAGIGPRTTNLKYAITGSDNIRKRFTGYEKDDETGLDFAEARMYQNRHGRFTATDPQTFNRYVYTGNNPINYTDPSGLNWCRNTATGATNFVKGRTECDTANGWEIADRSVVTITGGDWSKEKAKVGDTVILNADGTVTVNNSAEARAIAQGNSVAEVTVDASNETAAGAAASGSGQVSAGETSIGTSVSTPGEISLPCVSELGSCNSGSQSWSNPLLEIAANAPGLKSVEAIALIAETGSMAPGVGVPFAIIAATVRLGQGRLGEAGDNFINAVPGIGIFRKIDKAVDAATTGGRLGNAATRSQINDIATTLEARGYTITGGGQRGLKEEYLRPLLGGRKGGSYVDITATHPKYGTLRINTVDTLKNGVTPTARERRNAARIRKQLGGGHLLLIPKR